VSQYDDLDAAVLRHLGKHRSLSLLDMTSGEAWGEARRIEDATGRPAWRIVGCRLQALRKRGVIKYDSKFGWSKV